MRRRPLGSSTGTWSVAAAIVAVLIVAGCGGSARPSNTASTSSSEGAASVHPLVGVGDQKLDMFNDPRFLSLGIKHVRYDMSWDALSVPWQRPELTAWLNAARAHGLSVLVTIDHSRN